ncbi:MAG: glycosyltransferase family 4 protein [Bacteroidia bacterium]|nr:glycosyltransferase family 4 protein [Bacteroidia bacterium]
MTHRIAVNTRLLLPGRVEGISRFTFEVLKRMVERNPQVEFHFFFDRAYDPVHIFGPNVVPHVIPPPSRHPLLWYIWFHLMVPARIKKIQPTLFFSPEFYLCPLKQVPQYSVIHDLAYEHFPEDLRPSYAWYMRHYSPIYAEWAKEILTVSEFSKADIVEKYQIPPEKIHVVYNGVSDQFGPIDLAEQQAIRDKYTDGKPFFHFVGTLHPRKNITSLLKAFDSFKAKSKSEMKLLLVGRMGWKNQEALSIFESLSYKDEVKFSGFVPDEELAKIYASSQALVYIPTLEGFGIPVLEAMKSETAVICSDRSSLPEVAGDAAMLVDPFNPQETAEAMLKIAGDEASRIRLVQKGLQQKELYSWENTYQKVWKVIGAGLD